jgi:hypothetical protein
MHALKMELRETYCPLIIIGGTQANTALYLSFEWEAQFPTALRSIYVDRFGDPDIGFLRGEVLKLSPDAIEREVDRRSPMPGRTRLSDTPAERFRQRSRKALR